MIKRSLICFLFIFSLNNTLAQNPDIKKGLVIDYETKLPITNASVIFNTAKKFIYKTQTDSSGFFSIPPNVLNSYTEIKISRLNYYTLELNNKKSEKEKTLSIYELSPKGITLKEVVIKRNKRYRDTSIIDLTKEVFERNVMINDLFSQRGLYKDEKGNLYYNEKPVAELVVNGEVFFGKNNTKIYDKLPALAVAEIEIIETNIDSVTNTTLLNPTLRLNLRLKEKYNKGKFGSIISGIGTTKRYIAFANLFIYNNKQQISLTTNINNIDINEVQTDPIINFSPTGNNTVKKNTEITYRNLFNKKIEVNFSGKVRTEDRSFFVEQQREEMTTSQSSKSKSTSVSNYFKLDDLKLNIRYTLDSLNSFQFHNAFNYDHIENIDIINYLIRSNESTIVSDLNKNRNTKKNIFKTSLIYEKRNAKKKGRLFQLNILNEQIKNNVLETSTFFEKQHFLNFFASKYIKENNWAISASFIEPLGDQGYVKLVTTYKRDLLSFYSSHTGDSAIENLKDFDELSNSYIQPAISFQRTFNKTSLDATIKGMINLRTINNSTQLSSSLFNTDYNINANRNINKKTHLSWNYSSITNYPTANQLTSIANSFDLISQMRGNINLKPETKQSSGISYDSRISDSLSIIAVVEANRYNNTFGYNLNTETGKPQISFIDNIGKSFGAQANLSISKTFFYLGNINFRIGFNYAENPTIVNTKKTTTKGSGFTLSLSTTRSIVKGLTFSPTATSSYNRYSYEMGKQDLLTLIYTDKIALNIWGIEVNNYPILNFSNGTVNNLTWAVNSEIKKKIFKGYGLIWIKAYDLFNSFKFQGSLFNSSYTQSTTYSNLHQYFMIGASIKFNNLK